MPCMYALLQTRTMGNEPPEGPDHAARHCTGGAPPQSHPALPPKHLLIDTEKPLYIRIRNIKMYF